MLPRGRKPVVILEIRPSGRGVIWKISWFMDPQTKKIFSHIWYVWDSLWHLSALVS